MRGMLAFVLILLCAGCGSGAVVFAPTPLPPDLTPARYEHPGGAFSVTLPRSWAVYVQNTTTLAAAAFSIPGHDEPALTIAVVNLGTAIAVDAFGALIDQYQAQARPDLGHYSEQNRQAMGDGSWRITGIRQLTGGAAQQVNTFIDRDEAFMSVVEVVLPDEPLLFEQLQTAVNSISVNPSAPLLPADVSALSAASTSRFSVLNSAAWTTASGVLFITGEVANYGDQTALNLPVRAVLLGDDGQELAEARDVVMGHGITPGGFAPFSLRFGQGQVSRSTRYRIELGAPEDGGVVYGADVLAWTDASSFNRDGQLVIAGIVSNCRVALAPAQEELVLQPTAVPDCGTTTVHNPRVMVTIFDSGGNVIAAAFSDLAFDTLAPGDSAPYQLIVGEFGGQPANYIVNVQATG
ncbi:MAG: FxLYD domain-containing protein [Anaerolineae bacterium]